jgi:pilus assembly protein CpaC
MSFVRGLTLGIVMWGTPGGWAHAYPPNPHPSSALIQIGVEVVEVDEQKMQSLGIQWLSSLHVEEALVPPLFKVGTLMRGKLFADLQALINEGAADLLANPKLVTRDGATATFHAGGELPYATNSGTGNSVNIEFKTYGVGLKINPKLVHDQWIALSVEAEVSGPDVQNSVTLSGNTVPGIRSRQVSSEVTMEPGSTLTLAGLLQNQKEWIRSGVPGLMHIPVIGHLFSRKTKRIQHTSVMVFITPTILQNGDLTSPAPKAASTSTADDLIDALEKEAEHHG